jgi:hypothetical protein
MKYKRGNLMLGILIAVGAILIIYFLATSSNEAPVPAGEEKNEAPSGSTEEVKTDSSSKPSNSATVTPSTTSRSEKFLMNGIEYSLDLLSRKDSNGKTVYYQQFSMTVAYKTTVLVPDVDAVIRDLGAMTLTKFVSDDTTRTIIFASSARDGRVGALYKYDLRTNKFTKMFVSRFLPPSLSLKDNPELFAPNKMKFVSINDRTQTYTDARSLYLVNLVSDQAKVLTSARDGETFTYTLTGGIPYGVFSFVNDTTVSYSVFDPETPFPRTALMTRIVSFNPDEK